MPSWKYLLNTSRDVHAYYGGVPIMVGLGEIFILRCKRGLNSCQIPCMAH